jgi:hypothetical protein
MKILTNKRLAELEKNASNFIALYGSVQSDPDGPPSPQELLNLLAEVQAYRAKAKAFKKVVKNPRAKKK